jgi:hypothetical protein
MHSRHRRMPSCYLTVPGLLQHSAFTTHDSQRLDIKIRSGPHLQWFTVFTSCLHTFAMLLL